jgi:hypothetical protein
MDAGYDSADARFDSSLLTEVGNIFTALPDDDASIPRTHESTKGQNVMSGWGR